MRFFPDSLEPLYATNRPKRLAFADKGQTGFNKFWCEGVAQRPEREGNGLIDSDPRVPVSFSRVFQFRMFQLLRNFQELQSRYGEWAPPGTLTEPWKVNTLTIPS
jgi:hypothetical protein